ncbi:MAG: hypothetical protein LBP50_03560 [Tannerella sp.]|nr:hypothetical protein [Tannerella sp.]
MGKTVVNTGGRRIGNGVEQAGRNGCEQAASLGASRAGGSAKKGCRRYCTAMSASKGAVAPGGRNTPVWTGAPSTSRSNSSGSRVSEKSSNLTGLSARKFSAGAVQKDSAMMEFFRTKIRNVRVAV